LATKFERRTQNRELRRVFGPKSEKDGSWRKLNDDKLHSLYSSPNIVRVVKSRRMRWAVHVARMGRGEVFTGFWLGGPKRRDNWEELGVCVCVCVCVCERERITLRWTLGR
jgi:hypothetical protein